LGGSGTTAFLRGRPLLRGGVAAAARLREPDLGGRPRLRRADDVLLSPPSFSEFSELSSDHIIIIPVFSYRAPEQNPRELD
jgi:hypothetical protein